LSAKSNELKVTGLSASTAYKAYVIVVDAAGNKSGVSTINVTTSGLNSTVPTAQVTGLAFTDTDTTTGKMGGTVTWTAPADVSNVTDYVVYASADGTTEGAQLGSVAVGTNQLVIPADTDLAANIIVVTKNAVGEAVAANYASVAVTDVVPVVTSVTISPATASVNPGGTKQLAPTVAVTGAAAQTVTWTSSDGSNKVTVDGNGLVTVAADAPLGEYTITATSTFDNTKIGTAKIIVTDMVTNGLVLWLDGSDFPSPAGTMRDRSGNDYNATPHNFAYNSSSGSDGSGGIIFGGTNDYIQTDNPIPSMSNYTMSVWAKWAGSGTQFITAGALEQLEIQTSSSGGLRGLRFIPINSVYLDVTNAIPDNNWHQYTLVYSGTEAKAYRDGVSIGQKAASSASTTSAAVTLGQRTSGLYPFDGGISSTSIYNRALSEAEILKDYLASGRPAPALANEVSFADDSANTDSTVITLGAPSVTGNTFVYKISADGNPVSVPKIGDDLSSWTSVTSGDSILTENGIHIGVAEVNGDIKAMRFSDATSVVISPSPITNVSIAVGSYKIGDTINITVTAGAIGYTAGQVTVNGVNVAGTFADNTDNTYTLTYTVAGGNTDRTAVGEIPISIALKKNETAYEAYTEAPTSNGSVTIDATPPAAPIADSTSGFTLVTGAVNNETTGDTVDVVVGSSSAGLAEDITLEYKVSNNAPGVDAVADGIQAVSAGVAGSAVIFDEIPLATITTDRIWVRAVDAAGNKSAWVTLGGHLTACIAPTNFGAANCVSSYNIYLTWNDQSSNGLLDHYSLMRDGIVINDNLPHEAHFTYDSEFKVVKTYVYTLTAFDASGNSVSSVFSIVFHYS